MAGEERALHIHRHGDLFQRVHGIERNRSELRDRVRDHQFRDAVAIIEAPLRDL